MAQRLATEYVKASLQLTEAELLHFIQLFAEHHILLQVKVFENGNQEFVFRDDSGEEVVLSFERMRDTYISEGSCRLNNPKLANLMRKAISTFKGDAIVNRIYPHYTMVYHYTKGSVSKIIEMNAGNEKIIYEYKNTLGQLEHLFQKQRVEADIRIIHDEINRLLDARNSINNPKAHTAIDYKLQRMTHKLFVLEA